MLRCGKELSRLSVVTYTCVPSTQKAERQPETYSGTLSQRNNKNKQIAKNTE